MTSPRPARNGPRYRRFVLTMAVIVVAVFAAAYLLGGH